MFPITLTLNFLAASLLMVVTALGRVRPVMTSLGTHEKLPISLLLTRLGREQNSVVVVFLRSCRLYTVSLYFRLYSE